MADQNDQYQQCNSFLIANMLSNYQRADQNKNPVVVPTPLLMELRHKASQCFLAQSNLLESIGSLFCICMHCALSAKFDGDDELTSCSLMLETVMTECLKTLQSDTSDIAFSNGGSVYISNPIQILVSEQLNSQITVDMNMIFIDSLKLAKEILQDVGHQFRLCGKTRQIKKGEKDCIAAHSIYFMCCFGLTHVGITLSNSRKLNMVPGICESLIIISLFDFREKGAIVKAQSSMELPRPQSEKSPFPTLECRFKMCLNQAKALGITAIMCCIDERSLQEIRLVQSRMRKVAKLDAAAAFASLEASSFKTYLDSQHSSPHCKLESKGTGTGKHQLDFNADRLFLLGISEFSRATFSNPTDDHSDSTSTHISGLNSANTSSYSVTLRNTSTSMGVGNASLQGCLWKLQKHFRDAFCVLEPLRNILPYAALFASKSRVQSSQHMISTVYQGSESARPGQGSQDLSKCADVIQCSYLRVYLHYVPRHLDPRSPLYWALGHLVEYLYQQTVAGRGFPRSLENTARSLKKDLKVMKEKQMMSKFSFVLPSIGSPLPMSPARCADPTLTTPQRRKILGLAERLNLAAEQARVESRLEDVEYHIRGNADQQYEALLTRKIGSNAFDMALDDSVEAEQEVSLAWRKRKVPGSLYQSKKEQNWTDGLSPLLSAAYTDSVLEYQKQRRDEEATRSDAMVLELQTDIEAAASRRTQESLNAKESKMKDEKERIAFCVKFNAEKRSKLVENRKSERSERKRLVLEREKLRRQAEDAHSLAEHRKVLANKAYRDSILQTQERDRAKALEPVSMATRDEQLSLILSEQHRARKDQEEAQRLEELAGMLAEARAKMEEDADRVKGRLRKGAFQWHGGTVGFYDDIRQNPVSWIEFSDSYGDPVYYDPQTKKSQRRRPTDAPVVLAAADDEAAYDAVNGHGATEKYFAEISFKDNFNLEGGHYDGAGVWVVATGYYDENYSFVSYSGYYDERGKYVLYPKPEGDLSFMV